MNSILTYNAQGWDIEVWQTSQDFTVDIKHPCGEIVESCYLIRSKRNAIHWAESMTAKLGNASHECEDDYCTTNRDRAKINLKED